VDSPFYSAPPILDAEHPILPQVNERNCNRKLSLGPSWPFFSRSYLAAEMIHEHGKKGIGCPR
jgi:hypothetical protein